MKPPKPRPHRVDPLVRKARDIGWYIDEPSLWTTGWHWVVGGPMILRDRNCYARGIATTRAKAWTMLRACLNVEIGREGRKK